MSLTAEITPRDLSKLSIPSTSLSGLCLLHRKAVFFLMTFVWEAADLKKDPDRQRRYRCGWRQLCSGKGHRLYGNGGRHDRTHLTDAKPAKLNLTGKGNYTGNAAIRFEIPYAFTLAQTRFLALINGTGRMCL